MTDNKHLEEQLASVPVFAGLSRRQVGKLVDQSKETRHQAGRELAEEGEGALALHLITSGSASVSVRGESVRTLSEGDYFGEISLIDGKPRSATVTAETDLTTLAVPHVAFQKLLEEEPGFAAGLLQLLCQRLREAEAG